MHPFLALVILVVTPSICNGLQENLCDVFPKDLYIERGSDAQITCQTSCVPCKVYWTLNNRPVDKTLSKVIDSLHTNLTLRNFVNHSATLQCHREDTHEVIGGITVRTYTRPNKVSCILHYNNQKAAGVPELFTCSWEHQIYSSQKIKYTVLCDSCSSKSEICTSYEKTCTTSYGSGTLSKLVSLDGHANITVRANSTKWKAFSEVYGFHFLSIIKVARPELNVTAVSDHLLVEWYITLNGEFHCQVKYSKTANEGTQEWVHNKTLGENEKKGKLTVEKVESCSNYTFAVRCALDGALWSDWSQMKTVVTNLNKNDVKLSLWRKVAEADENGVRKVHAMWTGIPPTCPGIFNYTIKLQTDSLQGTQNWNTVCGDTFCEADVNQDAHRIYLTVLHNGFLLVENSVYVPAIGETGLPQVTDMQTSTLEGVILVSWTPPVEPVSGYMIDYTHNGYQCYWKETKYTNATLSDLLDKKTYNITVTPLFEDKTGHGTQALLICSRIGDPSNITAISVQAKDRSAYMSWNVQSQDKCSGVVVNYTVFYGTQNGPLHNVTVDGTKLDVLLRDLSPETDYSFYIKATALTGTTNSPERLFRTKKFDPMLSTALSVCGGILIVLVLSLGLCCAIQWRKFKEKPVPNPGNSSVALWPSTNREEGICPFPPFHNPPESICERVYTEDAQRMPTSQATGSNDNPTCDRTEEYADIATAPEEQIKDPFEPLETQQPSSPGELTELLPSDNGQFSPYRSQSPVESPTPKSSKQCKRVSVKQQERTPPLTVYVTLDMFEQSQRR